MSHHSKRHFHTYNFAPELAETHKLLQGTLVLGQRLLGRCILRAANRVSEQVQGFLLQSGACSH